MSAISTIPIQWRPIVLETCRRHRLGILDVLKRSHRPRVVRCRYEIWRRIKDTLGSSFGEIGRRFGYHHSSVMHGVRRAREWAS